MNKQLLKRVSAALSNSIFDNAFDEARRDELIDEIEAELAKPEQEPVAFLRHQPNEPDILIFAKTGKAIPDWFISSMEITLDPLYTHQPRQQEPLSFDSIIEATYALPSIVSDKLTAEQFVAFARAIERAHGIGGDK